MNFPELSIKARIDLGLLFYGYVFCIGHRARHTIFVTGVMWWDVEVEALQQRDELLAALRWARDRGENWPEVVRAAIANAEAAQ